MTARYDWIAIGPRGVYAIMDAGLASHAEVLAFRAEAEERGHSTMLVPVAEACRRHHEYLMQFEDMRQAASALAARRRSDEPLSFLPSPAQLDFFTVRPVTGPARAEGRHFRRTPLVWLATGRYRAALAGAEVRIALARISAMTPAPPPDGGTTDGGGPRSEETV